MPKLFVNAFDAMNYYQKESDKAQEELNNVYQAYSENDISPVVRRDIFTKTLEKFQDATKKANMWSRRFNIQSSIWHICTLSAGYEMCGIEFDPRYDVTISDLLNKIDFSLSTSYDMYGRSNTSCRSQEQYIDNLAPYLSQSVEICMMNSVMPSDNEDEIRERPTFQAVRHMDFIHFYENKKYLLSDNNQQKIDRLFRSYTKPWMAA